MVGKGGVHTIGVLWFQRQCWYVQQVHEWVWLRLCVVGVRKLITNLPGCLVPMILRGNADGWGAVQVGMGSHGGPWEPGMAYLG